MYVKMITLIKVGESKDYAYSHTKIYEVSAFSHSLDKDPDGNTHDTFTLTLLRNGGIERVSRVCLDDNYKMDVYVENDKGDTIGRY